jgi:ssDNA-binding Zn-finger/Zn-ribbon topoisomerase 1
MIRSRAKMTEFGEKNSRYFINLEKRNQRHKVITKLETSKGDIVTNANDILKEEASFYSKLYSSCNPPECNIEELLPLNNICPKLDENQKESCEGLITRNECLNALKTMPNNKTPGCDGFPTEWYKFFFTDIEQTVIDSFNYAFNNGKLSADQRRGIINLIPKKDKNPIY